VFFIPVFYVLLQRMSERRWPFQKPDDTTHPTAGVANVAADGTGVVTPAPSGHGR
jgi:hypothetical protein